ncbi:MAG TPA: PilW family protein [Gammaproteobacteria bacterium]|nr:PilW family protein [Gammaproteobacteria bacterium]
MMMQISSIRSRQGGVTLIELMVAMVLGLIIIGGVFAVYLSTADARRTNETIARIQEDARFALRTVKDDLRLAGNWGKTRTTGTLDGFKGLPTQLDPISGDCEDRWYIDLVQAVWAANGTNPFSGTCVPAHLANTDMLAVRYAAPEEATTLTSGVMYVRSDMARGEVFDGGVGATGSYSVDAEDHALVTHLYYVRPYTRVAGDNLPSLRRIRLAPGPALVDEEIISGIEDFQVQYGIDDDGDGSVNRYIDPDAGVNTARVIAIRLWVLARADSAEVGFTDDQAYQYADRKYTPNDGFRRMLVTSTILLRNRIPVPTT